MTLDELLNDARKRGELVYEMRQTYIKLFIMDKNPPGRCGAAPEHGSCAGLALRWIALRQRGGDYPFDPKALWSEAPYFEAVCDQKAFNDAKGSPLDWIQAVMSRYRVQPNWGRYTSLPGGVTAERIERAVFAGDGLYYIDMSRAGAGHVIVVQRSGTTYRLFDSNRGHFRLEGLDRFRKFLRDFLTTVTKDGVYQDKYTAHFRAVGFDAPRDETVNPAKMFPGVVTFSRNGGISHQAVAPRPFN